MEGYFWLVMVSRPQSRAAEVPNSFKVTAIQFGFDNVVQVLTMGAFSREDTRNFVDKLRDAAGVNKVCLLDALAPNKDSATNDISDFVTIKKAIDEADPS